MAEKIEQDHSRFREIVRGTVRRNLKKYIQRGEMIGQQGEKQVKIPVPQIDIPRFRFGKRDQGGIGQGDGEEGQAIASGEPGEGDGAGQAGDQPGEHDLEVDVALEDLAQILGEELELPHIEPKGQKRIRSVKEKYTGISRAGPESLRHFKRTFREALKRQIASGLYDPHRPMIIPIRDDKRYRSWKEDIQPQSNALIVYMMDVSGSMGDEQKEIVRIESFWIDTWLRSQYKGIESRYIIHDATAREVDRETFFRTKESGGTLISSAYKLALQILDREYPTEEWNIYPFHFSDGDNWSTDDTAVCISLLRDELIPRSNMFCYGQVYSPYGSGQFLKDLKKHFEEEDNLIMSEIRNKDGIVQSIKDFLGKGK